MHYLIRNIAKFSLVILLFVGCKPNPASYSQIPDLFKQYEKQPGFVIFEMTGGKNQNLITFGETHNEEILRSIKLYRILIYSQNDNILLADSVLRRFDKKLQALNMKPVEVKLDSINRVLYLPQNTDTVLNDAFLFVPLTSSSSPSLSIIHMIGEMSPEALSTVAKEFRLSL